MVPILSTDPVLHPIDDQLQQALEALDGYPIGNLSNPGDKAFNIIQSSIVGTAKYVGAFLEQTKSVVKSIIQQVRSTHAELQGFRAATETKTEAMHSTLMNAMSRITAIETNAVCKTSQEWIQIQNMSNNPNTSFRGRPAAESKAVMNLKVFGNDRMQIKEWNDKLINAISTVHGSSCRV